MVRNSARPLYVFLADVGGELLVQNQEEISGPSQTIFLCAMSVTSQCCSPSRCRVVAALCPAGFEATDIESLADHVARFSLGGIRAGGESPKTHYGLAQLLEHTEVS